MLNTVILPLSSSVLHNLKIPKEIQDSVDYGVYQQVAMVQCDQSGCTALHPPKTVYVLPSHASTIAQPT